MRSSDIILHLLPALFAAINAAASADNVVLTGEGRLSGTVLGIDEGGVVELVSGLADTPLKLKALAVDKVEFAPERLPPESAGAMVELANGDRLPVALGAMDGTRLTVNSVDAGPLSIPLKALKSLQLGVQARHVIYEGPRNSADWNDGWESKGWRLNDHAVVANGTAVATRRFDLPKQFTLKFTLKWENNPNFQITFADPLVAKSEGSAVDRYVLQFNAGGFSVIREAGKGRRTQTVLAPIHGADQFYSHEVAVEVRVDRKLSRIQLYLNDEPETSGIDPFADPPTGSGINFTNLSPSGSNQEIHNIEILESDNSIDRHRTEERGNPTMDSLISRDDDRWGGRLQSIRSGPDGAVFSFKSDFQEQPLEISESDVSTVFFAKTGEPPAEAPANPFILKLRGNGSLHVTTCRLGDNGVTAVHPLLGELKIGRAGLAALEKTTDANRK